MKIEILPCKLSHIRELANNLRPGDAAEAAVTGRPCRHLLIALWQQSNIRKVALVDGKVAAVWGCTAPLMVSEGEPWLFTTPEVERAPIRFFKQTRLEIAEMLKDHRSLVSSVSPDYTKAIKFFQKMGFTFGEERALGAAGVIFREIRMER